MVADERRRCGKWCFCWFWFVCGVWLCATVGFGVGLCGWCVFGAVVCSGVSGDGAGDEPVAVGALDQAERLYHVKKGGEARVNVGCACSGWWDLLEVSLDVVFCFAALDCWGQGASFAGGTALDVAFECGWYGLLCARRE